ncbi:serpin family protein [Niabella insulamsoli]|uniref:serpin family protein n=1 Tax=Niabella insulamsoli TaxID=3144874 RepID=UPI0031FBEAA7
MKKITLNLLVVTLTLLSTSCGKQNIPDETEKRQQSNVQHPIELAAPIANAFTDFSFYFFKNLQTEQKTEDNIFVSPLSLHIALGMLVNGAEATTKSEIMKALKSDHLSQTELNDAYKKLLNELPKADPLVKLALANAIFYKNDFNVEAPFLNTMKSSFNAQITGLPFVPDDLTTINKWASDNTNGKIPKVLNQLDPALVMLLMNVLYFKGDWRSKFDKANTTDQPFYLEDGTQKTVKMMKNQKDTFRLATGDNFSALQMPYGNGQFCATLLLPKEGKTIASVLNELDAVKWSQLQSNFVTSKVEVGLPKFKLEQEFKLNNTLEKMGMVKAFYPAAELQGINKTAPLKVDFVKQNTFAAVDEVGTEAAAVTTIGIEYTSVNPNPPQFICNRPFAFIISEKTSNTILFMGRLMNPQD